MFQGPRRKSPRKKLSRFSSRENRSFCFSSSPTTSERKWKGIRSSGEKCRKTKSSGKPVLITSPTIEAITTTSLGLSLKTLQNSSKNPERRGRSRTRSRPKSMATTTLLNFCLNFCISNRMLPAIPASRCWKIRLAPMWRARLIQGKADMRLHRFRIG
jgi:hypothetical protein